MKAAMDRGMMNMKLDEEDIHFDMLDTPEFSSAEDNMRSLIGCEWCKDGKYYIRYA